MPDKFLNKYRIPSTRAAWWDYSQNGIYFITICTAHREHYFGEIAVETPNLGVSVPIANESTIKTPSLGVSTISENGENGGKNEQWKPGMLGVIINQYKRICTIHICHILSGFAWQSRFYDHIIRNEMEFSRISTYILNNLLNWKDDKFSNQQP